jgi:hypothetical protein
MDTVTQSPNKQGGNDEDEKVHLSYIGFDDPIDVPRLRIGTGDDAEPDCRIGESCYDGGQQAFRWG